MYNNGVSLYCYILLAYSCANAHIGRLYYTVDTFTSTDTHSVCFLSVVCYEICRDINLTIIIIIINYCVLIFCDCSVVILLTLVNYMFILCGDLDWLRTSLNWPAVHVF